jgi:hypothetical protein
LNPSFEIHTSIIDTSVASLFIEIGQHGMSYIIINDASECIALATYHFSSGGNTEAVAAFLKEIASSRTFLQEHYKKIHIIYAYPYAILVPHEYMRHELKKDMLELMYGDAHDADIKTDYLYKHHLYNVYSVPKQVETAVGYLFSADSSIHLYSLLPDVLKEEGNHLYCIFYQSHFIVMLLKENKLQLIQTFDYKTTEDVAYYLLHLCESFDVKATEIAVHLNGMIDASSSLYQEISKYFLNLTFGSLPKSFTYPESINEYPPHFFSHLFAVASCV